MISETELMQHKQYAMGEVECDTCKYCEKCHKEGWTDCQKKKDIEEYYDNIACGDE